MTRATTDASATGTADGSHADDDVGARRARGIAVGHAAVTQPQRGVLAALLGQARGFTISARSVAMPVLLFGAFALLEQQMVSPFAGQTWVYAALLAVWGAYELRPAAP